VAAPMAQTKKITMVSTGSGEVGAAKLTGEVLEIVNKVPQLVKTLTGVDIAKVSVSVHPGNITLSNDNFSEHPRYIEKRCSGCEDQSCI
jgi:hypothetical protein